MPKLRVQVCTYNGHLAVGSDPAEPDLTSWLGATLKASDDHEEKDVEGEPSDIVAIGFQEMIPLHLSLLGLTATALDAHDHKLKAAIESHTRKLQGPDADGVETYTLMSKKVLGGIALLVYTRDKTVTNRVVDVRVATAACGMFNRMGNKGAVGCRITLEEGDSDEATLVEGDVDGDTGNTVLTFVTAHLAAHDSGLQRRNLDWKSIVERLVFAPDGPSEHYRPLRARDVFAKVKQATALDAGGIQIYDTSYLFFFGDLNYRISTKTPKPLAIHLISHKIKTDIPSLLVQDQLQQELTAGRALHHLREGAIDFTPTYKFKVGTLNEYAKMTKRVPGWCDRVLYSTWADGDGGAGKIIKKSIGADGEEIEREAKRKGAKVELYRSVMEFVKSDHKPVTAIIALPRHPKGSRALRLPFAAPFPIDPFWRQKKLVGWAIDRFVGFFWCLLMLAGAAVLAWFYRYWM
ncbi:DNase I-like protein [Meredithblackwellia eburnea MCA 4105]